MTRTSVTFARRALGAFHASVLCSLLLPGPARTAETAPGEADAAGSLPAPVLRGAVTRYSVDVERYRFGARADVRDLAFYPVPREPVDRSRYMAALEALDLDAIARNPDRGMEGPRVFLPVLAKYVATRDPGWAGACRAMLDRFHATMQREVREHGWFWQFESPAALLPLYRRHLVEGGAMPADDPAFRETWLTYCRNLHVWDSAPVEWRGGCHRSMPEAYSKGLAAEWYPDIPEAAGWRRYSSLVFGDFWKARDVAQNDTGYMMGPLIILACGGDLWTGDNRVFTDPGMRRLWDRLMLEVGPDGQVNPYGPNGGWNSTADYRIAMLERVASITRDGRYRFVAHKLFNYLRYQSRSTVGGAFRPEDGQAWHIALAWLFADDSIQPRQPDAGSVWTTRVEAARIPHTDKSVIERLMGNPDPRPDHGHVCCSWYLTGREWPDKLILRSGWEPGDLHVLVELHPTSFPANPGGIMGFNRWGAPFTQIVTSKGDSAENRLLIQDIDGTAPRRIHPDRLRHDERWRMGQMPDIQSEVTFFKDTPAATFARVQVRNADGLPVRYQREFILVRNRFLATRETITFEEPFHARVGPLWNTHNIGPQVGAHWANTFIHQPVAENGNRSARTPPADLLVWFAPHPECRLELVDRTSEDPRAEACPNQVRYVREGVFKAGDRLAFTQVYFPHPPYRARAASNNPNPGAKPAYADELQATAHASGIRVLRDDADAAVLRLELEPGKVDWIAFNPSGGRLRLGDTETTEPMEHRPEAPPATPTTRP